MRLLMRVLLSNNLRLICLTPIIICTIHALRTHVAILQHTLLHHIQHAPPLQHIKRSDGSVGCRRDGPPLRGGHAPSFGRSVEQPNEPSESCEPRQRDGGSLCCSPGAVYEFGRPVLLSSCPRMDQSYEGRRRRRGGQGGGGGSNGKAAEEGAVGGKRRYRGCDGGSHGGGGRGRMGALCTLQVWRVEVGPRSSR